MYQNLLVCREVYRQQLEMVEHNSQRIDDRIVSVSQPHVRPIKRGKAGRETEFGAKLSLSVIDGFSFVDRLSWDNFNESLDLIDQIERYHQSVRLLSRVGARRQDLSHPGQSSVLPIARHSPEWPTAGQAAPASFGRGQETSGG